MTKSWGAIVVPAVVSITVAGATGWITYRQDERAGMQREGERGIAALELYVSHPESFDPVKSPETAYDNMVALVLSAPEFIKPVLQDRLDNMVRSGGAQDSPDAVAAIMAALSRGEPPTGVQNKRKKVTPAGLPADVQPRDYRLYLQYGSSAEEFAQTFAERMKKEGFQIPPLENVTESTKVPEVRYYLRKQESLAAWLVSQINHQGSGEATAKSTFIGEGKKLPGGIVEVWIPAGWTDHSG